MDTRDSTAESSEGVRDGAEPVARLFERYALDLGRLAERHLSRKVAGRLDAEDVVQSAFRTFFRRDTAGEFQIDSSAQIWQLLAKITLLKARAKGRHHTTSKRDAGAEVPGGLDARWEAPGHEPGPAEAVEFVDQIEVLLRGLPPLYREVLEMRLRGYADPEIATELKVSRRTVQRALNLLRKRLARAREEDGGQEIRNT